MSDVVPYADAGGSPDWVREMCGLTACHPTLDWLKPVVGLRPHIAIWHEDDGVHQEARDDLSELVLYLKARFGKS